MVDELNRLWRQQLSTLKPARTDDGSIQWSDVSKILHDLHAQLKQELHTQETDFDHLQSTITNLEISYPDESERMERDIVAAQAELNRLIPTLEQFDAHFASIAATIEPGMNQLQALQARATYYKTAIEVEQRSQDAKRHAVEATSIALVKFQEFSTFVQSIPRQYTEIRLEALRRVESLSHGIKQFALVKLQETLKQLEWPKAFNEVIELEQQKVHVTAVAEAFAYLLSLELSDREVDTQNQRTGEWWAMECVLEPIRLRFRYHFERLESSTNCLTKPEWYLTHILDQTREYSLFLSHVLTPQLEKLTKESICVDARVLFLRGLIHTASQKLSKDLALLQTQKSLFCHTIDEILLFEEACDVEFQYDSYANSNRTAFPRLTDQLVNDHTLFLWTSIDIEYARETLDTLIIARDQTMHDTTQQFMSLLDYLCRRLVYMEQESHRYIYVTQVHFGLLTEFLRFCTTKVKASTSQYGPASTEVMMIIHAAQVIIDRLIMWEHSSLFIELLRRVTNSEQSRKEIIMMHLNHSKTMLTNAAKVAKETILAREEAAAVRHAIAGPGAMIGPTAALTAAYSVGSKTVKSLFGGASDTLTVENEECPVSEQQGEDESKQENASVHLNPEQVLFTQSIFERPVTEYKTLVSMGFQQIRDCLLEQVEQALTRYKQSPHWFDNRPTSSVIRRDVSSELVGAWEELARVLVISTRIFSSECRSQFWKPLVQAIDDAVIEVLGIFTERYDLRSSGYSLSTAASALGAVAPSSPLSVQSRSNRNLSQSRAWSMDAQAQFLVDMQALAQVISVCGMKSPQSFLKQTFDLCQLIQMEPAKRMSLQKAIGNEHVDDMEQITTMLEASGVKTLSPQQVRVFLLDQIGID